MHQATMISGIAFIVLANAAASQPAAQAAPITLADLVGMTVEMTVLRTQIILREGRKVSTEHKSDVKFAIRPGNRLEGTLYTTVKSPKGTRQGETKTLSATLEKAKNAKNFGPGSLVWFFNEAKLTELRVYERGGAFRREVSFARKSDGTITCNATEVFARENATGEIKLSSGVDGVPVTVVDSKQISSKCSLTKTP